MHFIVAGVSHNTAPLERLQKLAVNRRSLPALLNQATLRLGDAVILSTCNRTEIYTASEDVDTGRRQLREFITYIENRQENVTESLSEYVYTRIDDDALKHLFRVTSGLDALVLGEPEIAGQVAFALRTAGEARTVSSNLSRPFHHALRTGRKIRNGTEIGRSRVSVSSIGVDLLQRAIGDLKESRFLVIGAGETGMQAARALRRHGATDLTVASRRTSRAQAFAAELGGVAIEMSEVPAALKNTDILVTCTSALEPVISAGDVETAMAERPNRSLFILDLALPADVERETDSVRGVTLYDLESLSGIAEEHREERQAAAAEAENLIEREVAHFKELQTGLESEPMIRELGARAELIRNQELARAQKRLGSLDEDNLAVLDAMTRAIVNKLLADPISYMRQAGDLESAEAIAKAFDLRSEPEE